MPKFSKRSSARLDTVHRDLRIVALEAIKIYDFTVTFGRRTPSDQFELYKKGREFINERWAIVNEAAVVTHCDGYKKPSKHNGDPSEAADLVPYPIDWKDRSRFFYLAGIIEAISFRLRADGIIESVIQWGGHWKNFKDYPHYQIKKKP